MSYRKEDLINYRLEKSFKTFEEARTLGSSGFWGGSVNRLYYSCYYVVSALLAKDDISISTHNGVRTEFFKLYIKTGKLDKSFGSLYSNLMEKRHEGDYDDFHDFTQEEIMPLIDETENFITTIRNLISK